MGAGNFVPEGVIPLARDASSFLYNRCKNLYINHSPIHKKAYAKNSFPH
jgi:hypothetical protein